MATSQGVSSPVHRRGSSSHHLGFSLRRHQDVWTDALSWTRPLMVHCSLSSPVFFNLFNRACLLEVDLFAVVENAKLLVFNPRFSPSSSGCGRAGPGLEHWRKNYLYPPVKILPLVLLCLVEFIGWVTLVAPFWPACHWFPCL